MSGKPALAITYCTQCNWLLRAAWMAQEVLQTFSLEMGSVALIPGTGGIFEIRLDGDLVWDRRRDGGFPEAKVLKQLVRDRIDPGRDLGHIDRPHGPAASKVPKTP
jgi:selenoprotein W-related protein